MTSPTLPQAKPRLLEQHKYNWGAPPKEGEAAAAWDVSAEGVKNNMRTFRALKVKRARSSPSIVFRFPYCGHVTCHVAALHVPQFMPTQTEDQEKLRIWNQKLQKNPGFLEGRRAGHY